MPSKFEVCFPYGGSVDLKYDFRNILTAYKCRSNLYLRASPPAAGPSDTMLASYWDLEGPVWHHFDDQVGQALTQGDPRESQGGFFMIFNGCWTLHWSPIWTTFVYFFVI